MSTHRGVLALVLLVSLRRSLRVRAPAGASHRHPDRARTYPHSAPAYCHTCASYGCTSDPNRYIHTHRTHAHVGAGISNGCTTAYRHAHRYSYANARVRAVGAALRVRHGPAPRSRAGIRGAAGKSHGAKHLLCRGHGVPGPGLPGPSRRGKPPRWGRPLPGGDLPAQGRWGQGAVYSPRR